MNVTKKKLRTELISNLTVTSSPECRLNLSGFGGLWGQGKELNKLLEEVLQISFGWNTKIKTIMACRSSAIPCAAERCIFTNV